MEKEFLKTILNSVRTLSKRVFNTRIDIETLNDENKSDYINNDIIVETEYRGVISGKILLSSSNSGASYIASSISGVEVQNTEETIAGAKEFLNQLLGIVKRSYSSEVLGFTFSIPENITKQKYLNLINKSINTFKLNIENKQIYLDVICN
jgi:CheY-specific phosphatase CheX